MSLSLSKYELKVTDPRVKARVQKVLDFMKPMLVESRPRALSSKVLNDVFGTANHDLSGFLRANLLQPEGSYVAGKSSIQYTVKKPGFEKLSKAMGQVVPEPNLLVKELYSEIVDGTVAPEYSEPAPGLRRYHPVQNLPKKYRATLFTGWHDYDIESAAPSLVYQAAIKARERIGMEDDKEPYPSIKRLFQDKAAVRQHVQDLTNLNPKAVKQILNGLFFNARLQASRSTAIYALVNFDADLIKALKADPFVKALTREIKSMWTLLLDGRRAARGMDFLFKGIKSENPKKASERMAVYLELERQVISVMEDCLKSMGVRYVLMHDGFMTERAVSVPMLVETVREITGFEISMSEAVIGEPGLNVDTEDETELME